MNFEILKQKKVVSYIILALILVLLDFLIIIKPQILAIKKISPKIKKLSVDLKAFEDDQKNLTQLKQSLDNLKKTAEAMDKKVISEDQLLGVIEKISKISKEENIKINQISPIEDIKAKKIGNYSKGGLYPVLINITITSGFHQLGKFINRIENFDEFLKVLSVEIKFDKQLYIRQNVRLVLGAFILRK